MLSQCKIAYISVNNYDRLKIIAYWRSALKIHNCTYFCLPISIINENSFSGTLLTLNVSPTDNTVDEPHRTANNASITNGDTGPPSKTDVDQQDTNPGPLCAAPIIQQQNVSQQNY